MSAPQFTPGPWSIDGLALVVAPEPAERGEYKAIAQVRHNARANARLIAAAPELYEALENLLNESTDTALPSAMLLGAGLSATFVKAVERGLAALAKARGEQA